MSDERASRAAQKIFDLFQPGMGTRPDLPAVFAKEELSRVTEAIEAEYAEPAPNPDIARLLEVAQARAVVCRQHDDQAAAAALEALCGLLSAETAARKRAEARVDGERPQINMGTAAGIVMREQAEYATQIAAHERAGAELMLRLHRATEELTCESCGGTIAIGPPCRDEE